MIPITMRQPGRSTKGTSAGQVSAESLTFTVTDKVTVGAASGVLLAAVASGVGREVWLLVPSGADTGIYLNYGAAATSTKFGPLPAGIYVLNTRQEIRAIRAGSADIAVAIQVGVA